MTGTRWSDNPRWAFKIVPGTISAPRAPSHPVPRERVHQPISDVLGGPPVRRRCPRRIDIEKCYVIRSCESADLYEVLGADWGIFEVDALDGDRWITHHVFTDLAEARIQKERLVAMEALAGDSSGESEVFSNVEELKAAHPVAWEGQIAFVGDPDLTVYAYLSGTWRPISLPPRLVGVELKAGEAGSGPTDGVT